jgi:hypothetical protein
MKTNTHTDTYTNKLYNSLFLIETKTIFELIIEVFRDTQTLFRWLLIAMPSKECCALVDVAFSLNKISNFSIC